jgi:hypothetical protein
LAESTTSGLLANYDPSWSCTRNGATDSSLPSGAAGASASVTLAVGDFVNCTITNTAKSALLSLVKHAGTSTDVNKDGIIDAGDTIAYTFTVTNTGALTLGNIAVADSKVGPTTCPQLTLAPGASETCTADTLYTVTAADVTAGAVVNSATVHGTPPGSTIPVTSPPSTTSTPAQGPSPAVSVIKTASASNGDTSTLMVGETIAYFYLVTNVGNDNLVSLSINDPTLGAVTCPTPAAPGLAPGASENCTGNTPHTVIQVDVDAGTVTDSATATGTDPNGITSPTSGPSGVTVPTVLATPAVAIYKTAAVTPVADQSGARVGDAIAYSYTVTNTGNVTLTSVAVDDPTLGAVTCPTPLSPGLAPGASETCVGAVSHIVTQADVDAGKVTDSATAAGADAASATSPPSTPSTVTILTAAAAPAVSLVKAGTVSPVAGQGAAQIGDTIAYSYTVTNTGNVTLTSVRRGQTS